VLAVRVLFASTRGAGHFNPLVPFVEAALRAGHEVLVAGPPALAPAVERAGYPFWEGEAPPDELLGPVWAKVPTVSPEEANAIVIGTIFADLNVAAMLPRMQVAFEEWRPDLVLREQNEYASAIAADVHGVPQLRLGVALAHAEELGLELGAPALERHHPGSVAAIRSSPYMTLFPEALEDPDAAAPPRIHRFRDAAAGAAAAPLPDWWPGDDRPLVYVSFGSVTGTLPFAGAVYAAAQEAAGQVAARVLMTVGNDTDLDPFGPAPAHVRVERRVPQSDVLAEAALVVCHGGSGTTLGALAAGLPLVVVPLFADQPENARRVAAVGAGVAVEPEPSALRDGIDEVLGNPSYGSRAREIAAEMAALPPVDAAFSLT
jgi:UDP:flavonoid glycosyltransferase YjiC (YdhE family)